MNGDRQPLYGSEGSGDEPSNVEENKSSGMISIKQLHHLVSILDASDITELEMTRAIEGTHLVLRKARASNDEGQLTSPAAFSPEALPSAITEAATEAVYKVLAPLVGTFHTGAKPKSGALVAVGDYVKTGQLVATIESLNMLNEVESGISGHVLEIFVQEGQPVEYGQVIMTIEREKDAATRLR